MNISRKKKLLNDQGSQVDIKRLAIPEMTRKKEQREKLTKGLLLVTVLCGVLHRESQVARQLVGGPEGFENCVILESPFAREER